MVNRIRIAFIHVPKCAGVAVGAALRSTYFPLQVRLLSRMRKGKPFRVVGLNPRATARTAGVLGKSLPEVRTTILHYHLQDPTVAYLSGHVPFSAGIADEFGEDWSFVTVLRDPVRRFISEYFYNRYKRYDHFRITDELEAFLQTKEATRLGSQVVNFLTGRPNVYEQPTEAEVRLAIANLGRFAVLGVTERLDRFAAALESRFGKRPAIGRSNRSPAPVGAKASALVPEVLDQIRLLTAGDSAVYRNAVQLIEKGTHAGES